MNVYKWREHLQDRIDSMNHRSFLRDEMPFKIRMNMFLIKCSDIIVNFAGLLKPLADVALQSWKCPVNPSAVLYVVE